MKRFLLGLLIGAYLGAGLFAGLMMQRAVPPLNALGVGFIAITWPNVIRCARAANNCSPSGPQWLERYLFSFEEGNAQ